MVAQNLRRAVYAFAMGDALGGPYQYKTRGTYTFTGQSTQQSPLNGKWSDDTSMSLATINALFEPYNLQAVMDNYEQYYQQGKFTPEGEAFGMGEQTIKALEAYQQGGSLLREDAETANGNGALMRVWPVAFYTITADQTVEQVVNELTALTHGHEQSKLVANIWVAFLRVLPRLKNVERALEMAIRRYNRTPALVNELRMNGLTWLVIPEGQTADDVIHQLRELSIDEVPNSGYVVDTLKAVFWLLLQATSFQQAVQSAINIGGDTDTIAALVASAIAFVYDDLPTAWLDSLANKNVIERECLLADASHKFS